MNAEQQTIGDRIKKYREQKGLSLSQLARESDISKGYLWNLENPKDGDRSKRPSGETLYAIARVLGVTMSDLLGRELILERPKQLDPSLESFARKEGLSHADVDMLASIEWRGERPKTEERWRYIYHAIVTSKSLDKSARGE